MEVIDKPKNDINLNIAPISFKPIISLIPAPKHNNVDIQVKIVI